MTPSNPHGARTTTVRRLALLAVAAGLALLRCALPAAAEPAATATYWTVEPPGATWSEADGVNRSPTVGHDVEVVGTYADARGVQHGFLYSGGRYTRLDVPSPVAVNTSARSINARHQIVGSYYDGVAGKYCSYRYQDGAYSLLPGDCFADVLQSTVWGVDDAGDLVGATCCPRDVGFLDIAGQRTRYQVPGAAETTIYGLRNRRPARTGGFDVQMVGDYVDANGARHGVVFTGPAPRPATHFDVPFPGARNTSARGINDSDQIVGSYDGTTGSRGFIEDGGAFGSLLYPGSRQTWANGINDAGVTRADDVVGAYAGADGVEHGFLALVTSPLGGHV